jgi:uncharacterized membrane protein YkoI
MMRNFVTGTAVVLLVTAAAAWAGGDQEKTVNLDKVPKKVIDAVKAKYPKATIRSASTETEKDKTIYELSITNKKQKIDVSLTSEGKIVSIEAEIELKDVPMKVVKAFESKYPKAKVKLIEEVTKDKAHYYEFQITTADGQNVEASFDPTGKYLPPEPAPKK